MRFRKGQSPTSGEKRWAKNGRMSRDQKPEAAGKPNPNPFQIEELKRPAKLVKHFLLRRVSLCCGNRRRGGENEPIQAVLFVLDSLPVFFQQLLLPLAPDPLGENGDL